LTLALGWNKSSRRDWLLEKSVELGATQLLFWQADRSQGTIPAVPKPRWTDRMIQAAKQCGATWLPTVNTLNSIDEVIFSAKTYDQCLLLWESPSATTLLSPDMLAQGKTIAVFGPEGGLEDKETTQFMTKGFTSVSLGSTILRWETAALHCLSLAHFARQSG
ncbi:MAG: RNA methyltransferase, partial [Proteobacteria bacterium]|nr:RNA methyltransferase [Pseudomonadota bacterium]